MAVDNNRDWADQGKFLFTVHGLQSMQQRGINKDAVCLIVKQADQKSHVRGGRMSFGVSDAHIKKLRTEGLIEPSMCERLKNTYIVLSPPTDWGQPATVVTVLHTRSGASGRHYRKTSPLKRKRFNRSR
ncbi:MAG: hypothetical protein ACR2PW_06180 [Gammaproteobacteria bacterium]